MEIPLTGLSTFTGAIGMLLAWFFVGHRIKSTQTVISRSITFLHDFFFYMTWFFVLMCIPHVFMYTNPSYFPLGMAIGYTVGHIFLYIAFTSIALMTVNIIPQLVTKERFVKLGGIIANVIVTAITAATMIFGVHPAYDYSQHITQFNAAIPVGASIGILALLCLLPPGVLFLIGAVKNHGSKRLRSILLGSGFVIMTVSGPLHDNARSLQQFVFADIFTIIAIILISSGAIYRLSVKLAFNVSPQQSLSKASQ